MAEKGRQHDIRPLGESQHQRDGEDCDRAGHHGRGHHRKSTPQGQREERINERHTEQHQSKPGVSSRAPERIVSGRQVIDPDTTHDRPEQGQNIVMFARSAIDKIIYTRDPEIQCGHKNLHRHTHGTRRTQIKQRVSTAATATSRSCTGHVAALYAAIVFQKTSIRKEFIHGSVCAV